MIEQKVSTAVEFIERINRRDFTALEKLMDDTFVGIDEKDNSTSGPKGNVTGIKDYTQRNPEFQIHIAEVYTDSSIVSIVGRPTGSCNGRNRHESIVETCLYQIKVDGDRVRSFRFAIPDTVENRAKLGIAEANRITK